MLFDTRLDKKVIISLLTALIVFGLAFNATLQTLLSHWLAFDGNQSHGLLVLALTAYLVIKRLNDDAHITPSTRLPATVLILLLSFFWYLAALASIDIIEQLLLLPILALMFWSLLGKASALRLLPVLGLLIFVIPIWDYLVPFLVSAASIVVGKLVEMSRIPALIEGNSFYLPEGKVDIVGGCSGVKYLTIALFISYYILLTSRSSKGQKIILVSMAVALSILMNWIRILALILIAYYSKMQSPLVNDHETFGWLLFALVLIPMIAYGRRFPTGSEASTRSAAPTAGTRNGRTLVGLLLICLALIAGPLALYSARPTSPDTDGVNPFRELGDLTAAKLTRPGLLTLEHTQTLDVYRLDVSGPDVYVEVAENWQSGRQDKLVPYISSLYDRNSWASTSDSTMTLPDGNRVRSMQLEQRPYGQSQWVIYWFTVGSFKTPTYSSAKLLQVPAIMFGENLFRVTALRTACQSADCTTARARLAPLAAQFYNTEAF